MECMKKSFHVLKNNLYLKSFGSGAQAFAHSVTNAVNLLLLAFVYCFGIGLTKLFALIFRKRFLELKIIDSQKRSYWSDCKDAEYKTEDFYKMF